MKINIREHPYNSLVELLASNKTPQDAMAILASLNTLDYLDWEEIIEQKEAEKRVDRLFIECRYCGVISNKEAWIWVKRSTSGGDLHCHDCAIKLQPEHSYKCAWCQGSYISLGKPDTSMDTCGNNGGKCDIALKSVRSQLSRARILGLPASLTTRQWRISLEHFNNACAYCKGSNQDIEHYVPLSLGGGSTQDNCVPSCYRCNTTKRDKHPNEFSRLFPSENMARIEAYFSSLERTITA